MATVRQRIQVPVESQIQEQWQLANVYEPREINLCSAVKRTR